MIFVERVQRDGSEKLIAPDQNWERKAERKKNDAIDEREDHVFDTKIYGAEVVRAALEELFHRKCAYCEHPLPETDWDVEHFRPKGRVAEREEHPGYFWLAYKWENLYPSCVPCNQRRKDRPLWDDRVSKPAAGKVDQFPLSDETQRALSPDDHLDLEDPLLLDPCKPDPERHFHYLPNGHISDLDEYGDATIRICNLNRRRLKHSRARAMQNVVDLLEFFEECKDGDRDISEELVDKILNKYLGNQAQFSGAARYVYKNQEIFVS